MCGILGVVGTRDARRILHEGLARLEYRGYDSAGIAVVTPEGIHLTRTVGRVGTLDAEGLPEASAGIAHTRWATHGAPTEVNAHPHLSCDGRIAVAHNGIIENHLELAAGLVAAGHELVSETDTEVVAHLLEDAYAGDIAAALGEVAAKLEGSFALLAIHADEPGVLALARDGSPLVLGLGEDATYVASDVVAFRAHTDRALFLEDGDLARIAPGGYEVTPRTPRDLTPQRIPWDLDEATLAGFPHFMLKEIFDQPRTLSDALLGRTRPGRFELEGGLTLDELAAKDDWTLVACGSSYNAALAAAPLFERHAGVRVRCVLGSEYEPQRGPGPGSLVVAVTQSGETADTLSALRAARNLGYDTLAVCNVVGSSATRLAHGWLPIRAGPEVSVAATKSFTSQLAVLHALALQLGHAREGHLTATLSEAFEALGDVPNLARLALDELGPAEATGRWIARHDKAFVLGRGTCHAAALETALKVKEVSYVHAEGFAAGELKHGPLALIEEDTPVVAFVPGGARFARMVNNMREVAARGGRVVAITDDPDAVAEAGFEALSVPRGTPETFVYLATVVGQVLAYYAAVERGCDVDRPRNLAKSVTVE